LAFQILALRPAMVPFPRREALGYKALRVALRRLPEIGTQTVDLLLAEEVMRHGNSNNSSALAATAASCCMT